MKCTVIIDPSQEEQVVIHAHCRTSLVDTIEQLIAQNEQELLGRNDDEILRLSPEEVHCFVAENNKVYALTQTNRYAVSLRLYQLEERFSAQLIRINQSCLANPLHIERFRASLGGALLVCFKNGHSEYVSRRNIKSVKERLGI